MPAAASRAITVERFPFLIARIDSAFEQYKERFPDALRKLSRRHAVIALKGDQVYIEDLESSNGTFIGGKRLDERARRLADGDTVMFGSEQFAYKVRVESQQSRRSTRDRAWPDDRYGDAPPSAPSRSCRRRSHQAASQPARMRTRVRPSNRAIARDS